MAYQSTTSLQNYIGDSELFEGEKRLTFVGNTQVIHHPLEMLNTEEPANYSREVAITLRLLPLCHTAINPVIRQI